MKKIISLIFAKLTCKHKYRTLSEYRIHDDLAGESCITIITCEHCGKLKKIKI